MRLTTGRLSALVLAAVAVVTLVTAGVRNRAGTGSQLCTSARPRHGSATGCYPLHP
jgi:hypothetical protein